MLLLSDDQRPDTIAALGNRLIQTPNLDRLVRAGTTFTRAVSPNPLCVPSRAEILSGCTGFRNGVIPPFRSRLDPQLVLWPEAMRKAGYRTWYTGKWHTEGRPTTRGYDESQGMFARGGPTKPARLDTKGRAITGYVGYVFQSDDGRKFPELGVGLTPETPARIADAAIELHRAEVRAALLPPRQLHRTPRPAAPSAGACRPLRRGIDSPARPTSSPSTPSTTATSAAATSCSGPGRARLGWSAKSWHSTTP